MHMQVYSHPAVLSEAMHLCSQCSRERRTELFRQLVGGLSRVAEQRVVLSFSPQFLPMIETLVQQV